MSLRLLAGALLLGSFAMIRAFMPVPTAQATEKQPVHPKWEYKAVKLEATQCVLENQLATALNFAGDEGWELVGYERWAGIPKDAEGTLLIRPAATGPGRDHTPQTADSFQGTMTMKMGQPQPAACRLLFKRQAFAITNR